MWEVVIGGLLAIAGGVLSNIYISHKENKNRCYEKKVAIYKNVLEGIYLIESFLLDNNEKETAKKIIFFETEVEIFASNEVQNLLKQYRSYVSDILEKKYDVEDTVSLKDKKRKEIVEQIRKEVGSKIKGEKSNAN